MTVRDDAVCPSVGLERDLHSKEDVRIKELILGLQDTVRQLQSTIDAQGAVLKRLAAAVERACSVVSVHLTPLERAPVDEALRACHPAARACVPAHRRIPILGE